MTKTETVISDIYDAWRSQDLDRFATYLPNDFSHVVYIPTEVYPLGGLCSGKKAALARLGLIAAEFDFLRFDTSARMIHKEHAGVEIPIRYIATVKPGSCSRPRSPISGRSKRAGRSSSPSITISPDPGLCRQCDGPDGGVTAHARREAQYEHPPSLRSHARLGSFGMTSRGLPTPPPWYKEARCANRGNDNAKSNSDDSRRYLRCLAGAGS